MRKLELLSPAGDMDRLKMSVLYGADAVYLAGTTFGMRSFAGNFSPEELPLAVKYAHEAGLRIPEDLAIIGYNNTILTDACNPGLTSIDNSLETLCQHLIHTLMEVLNGKEMPGKTIFTGKLIIRGTTLK